MLQRDVLRSPFKNPTNIEAPSSTTYALHTNVAVSSFTQAQNDFSGRVKKEVHADSVFKSNITHDIHLSQSVSTDAKMSPGPGTYISAEMKLHKVDASSVKSPFGLLSPRFEYEKESLAEQVRQMKLAQNEQLTVIDQNVADRRMALQKTKQLHKHLDDMKPNAVFNSTVKRPTEDSFDTDDKKLMLSSIQST